MQKCPAQLGVFDTDVTWKSFLMLLGREYPNCRSARRGAVFSRIWQQLGCQGEASDGAQRHEIGHDQDCLTCR